MFKIKKFFVYTTQIFTGVLFGLVGLSLQLDYYLSVSIAVFAIIAISASTHDTAANGIYINELNNKQQAKYVGWQGVFYNIAKIVSGGLLVYAAGELEIVVGIVNAWMFVMFGYSIIMIVLGLYNRQMLPSGGAAKTVTSIKQRMLTLKNITI